MIKLSRLGRSLCAVALWLFAGFKVLGIAYHTYTDAPAPIELNLSIALWFVFALIFFSVLVFPRAVAPNVDYIMSLEEPMPFYHCIRPKSWIVVAFMMCLGISLRAFSLVGTDFILGFYSGLGISLLACLRFYVVPIVSLVRDRRQ